MVKEQTRLNQEAFRRTPMGMYCYNYDILRVMSGYGSINPAYRKINPLHVDYTPTWCQLGQVQSDDDE